ncbi:hypothetical protein LB534_06265 [Mesorhizobium sp. CA18]|uniref:hypothetical protein n=1 Tax=unclassified Mesorhizobium TaxID=325217 RepID=UPI001CCBAC1A|nr:MULTISPECIES: hypothetical protein [unclassified Mesorhizobium]MBZ9732854.1 hypothetical protein [Mesorhizobium sp. CA9]MBZ9766204.1 hypothetical protein [Mesorhizobium sp. CA6]MBZ9824884.1 hypothetical protein [Mesorhizobium sp. CA18]MBZ9830504.1 hypothetical protein [Mesorhizobium sp. CA2]MBZ9836191.1 hypothetical protein [Mesorhizobium sp. CA3]
MAIKETELQYTERMLRDMLAEAEAAEKAAADEARIARNKAARARTEKATALLNRANRPHPPRATADMAQASRDSLLDGLFPRTEWPEPPKAQFPRLADKSADRRSDFVIAALGITLGLICALFPWYIFFNQEQFGVQAIKFGGSGSNSGREGGGVVAERSEPLTVKDIPNADIDLFATGTVQDDPAPAPGDQPFPAAASEFKMVHVANGRAMIEDDTGLWIVQRGSVLPDSSRVASIEQRGGKWVIVTSADKVIQLSK